MSVVSWAARMTQPQLDQTDTILLLLAAETSDPRQRFRVDGITRLEKMIFLLEKETEFEKEISEPFTFEPYHYGPYSAEVYSAVDFLKAMRLLEERQIDVSTGLDVSEQVDVLDSDDLNQDALYVERQLTLTDDGKAVAKVLSTRVSSDGKKALTEIKDRFSTMPLRQLLRYVYGRYPAYAERSRIKDSL
jgi:uncharacterized protein